MSGGVAVGASVGVVLGSGVSEEVGDDVSVKDGDGVSGIVVGVAVNVDAATTLVAVAVGIKTALADKPHPNNADIIKANISHRTQRCSPRVVKAFVFFTSASGHSLPHRCATVPVAVVDHARPTMVPPSSSRKLCLESYHNRLERQLAARRVPQKSGSRLTRFDCRSDGTRMRVGYNSCRYSRHSMRVTR